MAQLQERGRRVPRLVVCHGWAGEYGHILSRLGIFKLFMVDCGSHLGSDLAIGESAKAENDVCWDVQRLHHKSFNLSTARTKSHWTFHVIQNYGRKILN